MIIRAQQMAAFEEAARSGFANEMAEHLREFAPAQTAPLSPTELRAVVDGGIARARVHGFTFCGPIRLYLELMFLFGSEFDSDPQYPWIADLLADAREDNQMQRADKLYEAALDYLDRVEGKSREHTAAAFDRLAQLNIDQFTAAGFELRLLSAIREVHPRKAAASEAALPKLIREAAAQAKELDMATPPGVALIALLMFMTGHGILADPIYAGRLRPALAGASGPEERSAALHQRVAALLRSARQMAAKSGA